MTKSGNPTLQFYTAVALIIGAVIGAGVFGIPYAISQSGFPIGLIHLIVIGSFVTLMTLYMGEVVLRTKKTMQFTGLAEKYLGKIGKWSMFSAMTFGIFGALTAYLVGIGQSTAYLLGGSSLWYTIIFFFLAATVVFYGLKAASHIEFGLSILLVFLFLVISAVLIPKVNISNISYINLSKAIMPYGVILFASLGYPIIPEIEILLRKQKKKMFSAIILAMIICLSIYALFSFSIVGTYGKNVAEIATESLSGNLNILGTIVALLAMTTGFLALGTVLKDVLHLDLKLNKTLSWAITCFGPLAIVLILSPDFISIIALTGIYIGGFTGILSAIMIKEARKKGDDKPLFIVPGGNALIYIAIIVFLTGIVYQTFALFDIL